MGKHCIKSLFVEVTNYCLQGCVHCSSCAGPFNYQSIPLKNLISLVEDTLPQGLESFIISGGEPLLYPDLIPLVDFLSEKKLDFSLYTCGVCKAEDGQLAPISTTLLRHLRERGISKLIFSMQGGSAAVHERVSGLAGSYAITVESIKRAKLMGIAVELHFVPMLINWQDVEAVVQTARNMGIKQVSLLRLVPQGRCDQSLMLTDDVELALDKNVEFLQSEYSDVVIRRGSPFNCRTLSAQECSAAKNKLLISATGEIFPCEAFKFLKGQRPKIYNNSSIYEVWNTDKLLNDIRNIRQEDIETCDTCSFYEGCHAGCHGQRLFFNNDMQIGPDPKCKAPYFIHRGAQ